MVIYQELQKTPDSHLQLTLEEILLSNAILIDATSDEETYKDRLIKFGIAFALDKQRHFFYIRENSARIAKIKSSYVDQYIIEASGYYDFIRLLNENEESLSTEPQVKPYKPTGIIYEAFSVFGVNVSTDPDLTKTIKKFAADKKWNAVFHKPLPGIIKDKELSQQVGARTFSLFCINRFVDASVYIAIGLALGLGIPFLIIIEEEMIMPEILNGYAGVIAYTSNTDLAKKLTEYTKIFFSPEIFKTWDGFTYFYLLSKIEKRLNESGSEIEIEEIEKITLAITNLGRAPIIQAYVLLADIYRRKAQTIVPLNTSYLAQAISWYEKALSIQPNNQRCIDGIDSTKKLIQLIDLIANNNYDSIPELIYLIGNNINLEQYRYLRSFLLDEVKNLFEKKEFLHAIALLAAIQKHDQSEEIHRLWNNVNPENFIELIQKYQENGINTTAELRVALEKNKKISDQLSIASKAIDQANQIKARLDRTTAELRVALEENREISDQLKNASKAIDQANQIKAKLDRTTDFYGKNIFVNFGVGWATYVPLKGLPYIIGLTQDTSEQ